MLVVADEELAGHELGGVHHVQQLLLAGAFRLQVLLEELLHLAQFITVGYFSGQAWNVRLMLLGSLPAQGSVGLPACKNKTQPLQSEGSIPRNCGRLHKAASYEQPPTVLLK